MEELAEVVFPTVQTFDLSVQNVAIGVLDERRLWWGFRFGLTKESKDLGKVIVASRCL